VQLLLFEEMCYLKLFVNVLVEAAALLQCLEYFNAMYQREPPGNKQRLKYLQMKYSTLYMDASIQTEDIRVILCSIEVQTNETIVLTNDAALQTDNLLPSTAVCEAEVQTEKSTVVEISLQTDDLCNSIAPPVQEVEIQQLCEGSNNDKFLLWLENTRVFS